MSNPSFNDKFLSISKQLNIDTNNASKLLEDSLGDEYIVIKKENALLFQENNFVEDLLLTLNKPESSIKHCYIKKDNNNITISFQPFNSKFNDEYTYCRHLTINDARHNCLKGFDQNDIDSVNSLLRKYKFKDTFENQYFANRIINNLNFEDNQYGHFFKFTPEEKYNEFIINGKPYIKKYGKIDLPNFLSIKQKTYQPDNNYSKIYGHAGFIELKNLEPALKEIQGEYEFDSMYLIPYTTIIFEYFDSLLNIDRLISQVWYYGDTDQIINQNINNFLKEHRK